MHWAMCLRCTDAWPHDGSTLDLTNSINIELQPVPEGWSHSEATEFYNTQRARPLE